MQVQSATTAPHLPISQSSSNEEQKGNNTLSKQVAYVASTLFSNICLAIGTSDKIAKSMQESGTWRAKEVYESIKEGVGSGPFPSMFCRSAFHAFKQKMMKGKIQESPQVLEFRSLQDPEKSTSILAKKAMETAAYTAFAHPLVRVGLIKGVNSFSKVGAAAYDASLGGSTSAAALVGIGFFFTSIDEDENTGSIDQDTLLSLEKKFEKKSQQSFFKNIAVKTRETLCHPVKWGSALITAGIAYNMFSGPLKGAYPRSDWSYSIEKGLGNLAVTFLGMSLFTKASELGYNAVYAAGKGYDYIEGNSVEVEPKPKQWPSWQTTAAKAVFWLSCLGGVAAITTIPGKELSNFFGIHTPLLAMIAISQKHSMFDQSLENARKIIQQQAQQGLQAHAILLQKKQENQQVIPDTEIKKLQIEEQNQKIDKTIAVIEQKMQLIEEKLQEVNKAEEDFYSKPLRLTQAKNTTEKSRFPIFSDSIEEIEDPLVHKGKAALTYGVKGALNWVFWRAFVADIVSECSIATRNATVTFMTKSDKVKKYIGNDLDFRKTAAVAVPTICAGILGTAMPYLISSTLGDKRSIYQVVSGSDNISWVPGLLSYVENTLGISIPQSLI